MQKSTIVFICQEHDLGSYSSAKSSLSIFLNMKILINLPKAFGEFIFPVSKKKCPIIL